MPADFRFSPEAEALRAEIIAWLDASDVWSSPEARDPLAIDPADLTGIAEPVERRLHAEAGTRGWLGMPPEPQAVFNFEAARADAPVVDTAMTLAGAALVAFATNDLHHSVLAAMRAGAVEACCAYTEPGAGSDLGLVTTNATRATGGDGDGDGEAKRGGWVLDGVKSLVTGAHKSQWCITIARTNNDPAAQPRHALSMFLVDLRSPGVHIKRPRTMNGWTLDEIHFERVHLPAASLLGTLGAGWRQMSTALAAERSGMFWLGFARAQLDRLARYVCTTPVDGPHGAPATRSRRARGPRPVLADDPLVSDEIGRLETRYACAQLAARRALWSNVNGVDLAAAPASAKVVCTELLTDIAQTASEIAGADGLVWAPLFSAADDADDTPGDDRADRRGALPTGGRFAWEYLERVHGTIGAGANEVHLDAIAAAVLRGRP